MTAANCRAHPLGCRCHATPRPTEAPRPDWELPVLAEVDATPPQAPAPRTGALDLLVARIQTARRTMRRPT